VPDRATVDVLPDTELLAMVSAPLAAPELLGLNCTVSVVD
jgi:hypothetical protein